MKRFLLQICLFFFIAIPLILFTGLFFKLDGYTDPFYLRFSSPKQSSLILGTSRAAQGIQPLVIDSILNRNDIYNFSFTIGHSPYGPIYFNCIKKKLNENTKDGIFILAVDPWSISGPSKNPNDSTKFPEVALVLGQVNEVNLNPNVFYLWKSYNKPLFNLFSQDKSTGTFLHKDGWLEISTSMDSVSITKRINEKMEDYLKNVLPNCKFSSLRMEYLHKTIAYLKEHGKVFLVRLPEHPRMTAIEDKLMPDFNSKINYMAMQMNVPYKNFRSKEGGYQFTDGNHLYKASGRIVTREIGEWIKNFYKN